MSKRASLADGYARLEQIAEKLKLPLWWVESLTVEYLSCREFLKKNEFWHFNFNLINQERVEQIGSPSVVFNDTLLVQNIPQEQVIERIFTLLMGLPTGRLDHNVLPNGLVSEQYTPFQLNSLTAWDQKLGFSDNAKIFYDGRFYQIRIAEFGRISSDNQTLRLV